MKALVGLRVKMVLVSHTRKSVPHPLGFSWGGTFRCISHVWSQWDVGSFWPKSKSQSNVTVSIMSCVGGNVCGRSWAMSITRPGNILWSDEGCISIIIFILHIKAFLKLFFLLFHSHVTFISWNYSFKAAVFSLHGCKLHKGKLTTPSSEENWEKSSSSFFAFYACYMYKQSDE